jgi:hypothetical protein
MANIQRGESEVTIDGVTYHLVIDHGALAHAEWAAGVKIQELLPALGDPTQPQTLAVGAIVYGALRARHRSMTLGDALALAEAGQEALGEALGEAMAGAFPDAAQNGAAKANPPKPPRGAGTKSRPTGRRKG